MILGSTFKVANGSGNSANLTSAPDALELPQRLLTKLQIAIPGYELLDKIDSGGQATVYRARELTSGLTVAIKVLNGGAHAGDDSRERLYREAATLKALNHPNIVCVIESGQTAMGLDYVVMNYVDGRPLDALWTDAGFTAAIAPVPPARLRLFKHICDVVQIAHLKGITHRDLSPSNILITSDGQPHVLDFGLATTAFNDLLSPTGRHVTLAGQFLGKVAYAAPEQASGGRNVDIRTDVYALGVILYQLVTGGLFPYEVVGNLVDVLNNIIHTRPLPPSSARAGGNSSAERSFVRPNPPLVNETIEAIVLRALEKDPADRYQSAGEFSADINQYLAGQPTVASRRQNPIRRKSRFTPARIAACSISIILFLGVLMNLRTLLTWIGLSAAVTAAGAGPASAPSGNASAPELSDRQKSLLMQLADAEANIQAINKALKLTGYKVGIAYDRIASSEKGNELMDRKGGGPVRWDEFYGKTARDFCAPQSSATYHREGNGKTVDAKVAVNNTALKRPQQFEFTYKANSEQITRANDQIASLQHDQAALLERRQFHETAQSRLWAIIALEQLKDREIPLEPICRFNLKGVGTKDSKANILRPLIVFLRTADRGSADGLDSITRDQSATFGDINSRTKSAYAALQTALADAMIDTDLNPDDKARVEAEKVICKHIAEECAVIVDNYANALDRDKAKEDNSKLKFREQLQESLSQFTSEVSDLDARIGELAGVWKIEPDKTAISADNVPAAGDPIKSGTTWESDDHRTVLTIISRSGQTFQGRLIAAESVAWEISGTIKDGKLTWYGKDVRAIKGGPGLDNIGTLNGNRLDFTYRKPNGVMAVAPSLTLVANAEGGWTELFNGADLTGWNNETGGSRWRVEDGILIGQTTDDVGGELRTTKSDYRDFVIRVEAMINDAGDSGIMLRATKAGEYKAQIDVNGPAKNKTGGLFVLPHGQAPITPPTAHVSPSPAPANRWFVMEVQMRGYEITVSVDGKVVSRYEDPSRLFESGMIGLQARLRATTVKFRKIQIRELKPESK